MNWFIKRLQEPSTFAAMAAPLMAFGVIDESHLNQAAMILGAVSALVGVVKKDVGAQGE